MPEEFPLDEDGRAVEVHRRITLRTPGLAGRATVHEAAGSGTRAAEQTTEALVAALALNDIEEDLTIEIREPRERTESSGTRAAGGPDDIVMQVADPGNGWCQVVLYASEDGALTWHFPEVTPGLLTYRIPRAVMPTAEAPGAHRGLTGAIGTKLLKVLVFRLVREGAGWVGARFAEFVENRRHPHRLRSVGSDDYRVPGAELSAEALAHMEMGRTLLLLHGTISSTHGAFGALPVETMRELHAAYEGRIIAFDHPTVSKTPVDNIAWLTDHLRARDARLDVDIVCHSRGGLVGRVLTERPDLAAAADTLSVGKIVLVGTPNAGTALADVGKHEQLLDRFTSLLQLVPDNGVTDALDIVLALVKQIAAGVAEGLDGLMSMNPAQPFLTEQLTGRHPTGARYFTVGANYEPPAGSSLLRIAGDGGVDLVFGRADNDLIVPTAGALALDGTHPLPVTDHLAVDATAAVDHFGYFDHPALTESLVRWLRTG
ncbi:alpha/beta hydrolase [Nocardia cyriacigeorgica]|uniref:alpha/beta hydrolase n=1 Tax=Nocardia cyriacigeorgica TaxID=135487 RepID=UPI002456AEAD|nr:alpha/beta hydrolase [Nocardia cyriacigeorgica]